MPTTTTDRQHQPGCPALGGYGQGVEPCACSAGEEAEPLSLAAAIKASGQFTNLQTLDRAAAELIRLYGRVRELEAQEEIQRDVLNLALGVANKAGAQLAAEAARTASEKLRADQLGSQHATQAALNRQAREQLAALKAAPGVQLHPARAGRIYVAGPMTGLPDFNFPAFNLAAAELRAKGWHVENPAEHGIVDGAEWADYLHFDLWRLSTCAAVCLLPGWSKSRGAALEVHVAMTLGMSIFYAPGAEQVAGVPAPAAGAVPSDAEIIGALEAAGVEFLEFMGGRDGKTPVHTTSGSQKASSVIAGCRALLAANPPAQALAVPEDCPHLIWFDDQDRMPEMFAGHGARSAAAKRFQQISQQWNAHLFVRIERNSRDCRYPVAAVHAPEAQHVQRVPCKPVHPKGMTSINARLAFNQGWISSERHHGIRAVDVAQAVAEGAA